MKNLEKSHTRTERRQNVLTGSTINSSQYGILILLNGHHEQLVKTVRGSMIFKGSLLVIDIMIYRRSLENKWSLHSLLLFPFFCPVCEAHQISPWLQTPPCFFLTLQFVLGKSICILTVMCAIKEPWVMLHMNTEGFLSFSIFFFEGMEQRLAQHGWHYCRPLFHSFMCWWETKLFEDNADTAGVMMLWATASFLGWSCLKGRISVLPLRRETILFLQSTDGVECLTSPEVSLLMRFFFLIHVLSQITIIRHVIYVWWRVVASYTFATFSHGALK